MTCGCRMIHRDLNLYICCKSAPKRARIKGVLAKDPAMKKRGVPE
jgi:ribosomal protein L36